ncbi:MAG: hypothetical protein EOO46_16260 [Flavobacterium sp.]|nr:MAG: hypothetical protein EOO46_16260 [Flavobacterium sp.]
MMNKSSFFEVFMPVKKKIEKGQKMKSLPNKKDSKNKQITNKPLYENKTVNRNIEIEPEDLIKQYKYHELKDGSGYKMFPIVKGKNLPAIIVELRPESIASTNQKGGVGKTTTCVNLAVGLGKLHYKILLVDLDPQANLKDVTGYKASESEKHKEISKVLLHGDSVNKHIVKTGFENVYLIPGSSNLEEQLISKFNQTPGKEYLLKEALDEVREEFDFIIIDTPPGLGLAWVMGMTEATAYFIPSPAESMSINGLISLEEKIAIVKKRINPKLKRLGMLITQDIKKNPFSRPLKKFLIETGEERNLPVLGVIPNSSIFLQAAGNGIPVIIGKPKSPAGIAYSQLATQILGSLAEQSKIAQVNNGPQIMKDINSEIKARGLSEDEDDSIFDEGI